MRPGDRRQELDATLRAAYAEGLLTESTFVRRVDALLTTGVVEPERLVGDLTVRGPVGTRRGLASRLAAALVATVHRATGGPRVPLLALDWSGTVERLTVGRLDSCDVVLDHPTVSRMHAELAFRDGAWVLRDLDSKNGTSINGARVVRSQVRAGDLIALGEQRLRVD